MPRECHQGSRRLTQRKAPSITLGLSFSYHVYMQKTTAGKMIIANALPEDMQGWADKPLDKKNLAALFSELAMRHPDDYRDVSHALLQIARAGALESGSNSFGLKHIRVSPIALARRAALAKTLAAIDDNDDLSDTDRKNKMIIAVGKAKDGLDNELLAEASGEDSPLARMITSGARGNPGGLASLRGGDYQYIDSAGSPLPVPIVKSYGEGLSPVEYWAGSYGARQGLISAKFATAEAGYLAKRLQQAAHRLIVTGHDDDSFDPKNTLGMPVSTNDLESEGSLLSHPTGGYARNTILTPKILFDLKKQGIGRILVRSPIVGGAADGGLLARDVGIRESGNFPSSGNIVGLTAAQSLAERLSQTQLSAKHLGGVAGKGATQLTEGFPLVEQLLDIPKAFKNGAAHAQVDGQVQMISDAPAGGKYITVDGHDHYVPIGMEINVQKGDTVEAGDSMSEGIPNPSEVVKHKGIGEGRRYFTHQLGGVLRNAGVNAHRRNVELVARAMIDNVKLDEEYGDWLPGDVVSYQSIERGWQPRHGAEERDPKSSIGKYLEKPVLHYTVGTKIKPSMIKDFDEFGVKSIHTHTDPPPFQPVMVRSEDILHNDPDWITKMYGSGIKKNLLKDVHRGGDSSTVGTSFVPGLAKGVDFGIIGKVKEGMEKEAFLPLVGLMPGAREVGKQVFRAAKPIGKQIVAQGGVDTVGQVGGAIAGDSDWEGSLDDPNDWAARRMRHEGMTSGDEYRANRAADQTIEDTAMGVPLAAASFGTSLALQAGKDYVVDPLRDEYNRQQYNSQYDKLAPLNSAQAPQEGAGMRPADEQSSLAVLQREPEGQRRFHAAELAAQPYMDKAQQFYGQDFDKTKSTWMPKFLSKYVGNRGTSYKQQLEQKERPIFEEFAQTGDSNKMYSDLGALHAQEANNRGQQSTGMDMSAPQQYIPPQISDQQKQTLNQNAGLATQGQIAIGKANSKMKDDQVVNKITADKYRGHTPLTMRTLAAEKPQDYELQAMRSRAQQGDKERVDRVVAQQNTEAAQMQADVAKNDPATLQAQQEAQKRYDDLMAGGGEGGMIHRQNQEFLKTHQAPKLERGSPEYIAHHNAISNVSDDMMKPDWKPGSPGYTASQTQPSNYNQLGQNAANKMNVAKPKPLPQAQPQAMPQSKAPGMPKMPAAPPVATVPGGKAPAGARPLG